MVKSNAETLIGDTEKGRESISEYGRLKEGREREREEKDFRQMVQFKVSFDVVFLFNTFLFPDSKCKSGLCTYVCYLKKVWGQTFKANYRIF